MSGQRSTPAACPPYQCPGCGKEKNGTDHKAREAWSCFLFRCGPKLHRSRSWEGAKRTVYVQLTKVKELENDRKELTKNARRVNMKELVKYLKTKQHDGNFQAFFAAHGHLCKVRRGYEFPVEEWLREGYLRDSTQTGASSSTVSSPGPQRKRRRVVDTFVDKLKEAFRQGVGLVSLADDDEKSPPVAVNVDWVDIFSPPREEEEERHLQGNTDWNKTDYRIKNLTVNHLTIQSDPSIKANMRVHETIRVGENKIGVYTYTFKNDPHNIQRIGFNAAEIQRAYPELVRLSKYGIRSVDYIGMSAVTWGRLQRLEKRVDRVEERTDRVESRTDRVEASQAKQEEKMKKLEKKLEMALASISPWRDPLRRVLKQPFNANTQLHRHLRVYHEGTREFIDKKFKSWLGVRKSRIFWLCAHPGMGKSVAVAHICNKFKDNVAALHFCHHKHPSTRETWRILFSLAYQLAEKIPWYHERLLEVVDYIEKGDDKIDDVWPLLFVDPFGDPPENLCPAKEKIVLVIDAIDEADCKGRDILRVLRKHVEGLPEWVAIAVSSRPEVNIVDEMRRYRPVWIELDETNNDDIRLFFKDELCKEWRLNDLQLEKTVGFLLEKTKGMFLYAKFALDMLPETMGSSSIKDIAKLVQQLPDGVDGYYEESFERVCARESFHDSDLDRILQVIVAARRNLSVWELAQIVKKDCHAVNKTLEPLGALLLSMPQWNEWKTSFVELCHKSLTDWLVDAKQSLRGRPHPYYVEGEKGHQTLAKACWNRILVPSIHILPFKGLPPGQPFPIEELQKRLFTKGNDREAMCNLVRYAVRCSGAHAENAGNNEPYKAILLKYIDSLQMYEMYLRLCPDEIGELIQVLKHAVRYFAHVARETGVDADQTKLKQWLRWARVVLTRAVEQNEPRCVYPYALQMPEGSAPCLAARREMKHWLPRVPQALRWTIANKPQQLSAALLELKGHRGEVWSVSFSKDGERVVSGSWDRTVRIWHAETGRELQKLKGHGSLITSVSFAPDGKRVASGSLDNIVRIWDLETGNQQHKLKGHTHFVNSVSYSPGGEFLVSGSRDKTARIWDTKKGEQLLVFNDHTSTINCVSFSPSGKLVVSGSGYMFTSNEDNTVRIWNAKTGEQKWKFSGHTCGVNSVTFSSDGRFVVSGSSDGTTRIWDVHTGQQKHELKGHGYQVMSACISQSCKFVVTGASDTIVRVWDVETGRLQRELKGHGRDVLSVSCSPDDKRVVSGGHDNTIWIWDLETKDDQRKLSGHAGWVQSVSFDYVGNRVVSGGASTIHIWNAKTGRHLQELKGHTHYVKSVSFSPNGQRVASGSYDGSVRIWDPETGRQLQKLRGHSDGVMSVVFFPDGKRILSAGRDNTVRVWDAEKGQQLQMLEYSAWVWSVSFSRDAKRFASVGYDFMVRVMDAETRKQLHEFKAEKQYINSVCFSPDGTRVMIGSDSNYPRIFDIETGQEKLKLEGHKSGTEAVSYSPDGKLVMSASTDKSVRLWDPNTGQPRQCYKGHTSAVWSAAFSPDGENIASASSDRTVRIWCHSKAYSCSRTNQFWSLDMSVIPYPLFGCFVYTCESVERE